MIDYQKHRERLAEIIKGKRYFIFTNGDGICIRIEFKGNDGGIDVRDYPYRGEENEFSCGLVNDAKELLDKAEERDKYQKMYDEVIAELAIMAKERTKAVERAEKFKKVIQRTVTFWRKLEGGKREVEFNLFMINLLSGLEDSAPIDKGKI